MQLVVPVFVELYESAMQMFASKFSHISRALSYSVHLASLKVEIIYAKPAKR